MLQHWNVESFVFVTFISRFFATKHSLLLIIQLSFNPFSIRENYVVATSFNHEIITMQV